VINELALTVTAFSHDAKTGALTTLQTISTLPAGVEPVRADEVCSLEPELLRLRVHHRDECGAVTVAHIVGERDGRVVGALDQGCADQVADRDALTCAQVHGRLADRGSIRADAHDVVPLRMLERDEHGHELRDARDRDT